MFSVSDAAIRGAAAGPNASSIATQTTAVVPSKSSPTLNNGDKQVHAPNENKKDIPKKVSTSLYSV